MSDEGKNIWSDNDTEERLMNLAVFKLPLTGKEMGCALMFALPLMSILLIGSMFV